MTAANKVYDGTTSATLTSCTVTGAVGDDVECGGTAAFDTATVGTGKTVTATVTLTGPAAGNYALASPTSTTTASITALPVTPAITAANKTYDGTTTATLTSCTVTGALGGDVVACTGTASFDIRDRRHRQDGDGERPDADGRGGGQLRAVVHHGDDDRGHHGGDGDADRHGGEQGLRRDDGGDAHQLHGDWRDGRRGGVHRHGGLRHGERRHGQDGDGERA